jgi:hypothetical protein
MQARRFKIAPSVKQTPDLNLLAQTLVSAAMARAAAGPPKRDARTQVESCPSR